MERLQQTQEAWSHESVLDRSTGKLRPLASGLTASSSSLNWKGVLVEHHRLHHYDSSEIMWVNHVILLHLGPSFEMEFENDGEIYRKELQPGHISFYPALTHCRHRSLQPTEFALISLSPEFVSIACCDMFALDSIQWARQTGISDSYAESVCRALLKETLGGSPTGSMYAQSLATSLAVHLASQYGGAEVCSQQTNGGLSASQLKRSIEFVHLNLGEDVSLKKMAGAAGLSPFHFARQFKKSMGFSPYQFVLKQRVNKAKQLLLKGEKNLAEIAVDVGFYDQSHFAQQFRRHCGITPKKYAAQCGLTKARRKRLS